MNCTLRLFLVYTKQVLRTLNSLAVLPVFLLKSEVGLH